MLMFILLAVWAATVSCNQNNLPSFVTSKTLDCTKHHSPSDPCKLFLIVEPLTSMTYYKVTDNVRELMGYRATFDSTGNLVPLNKEVKTENMLPPIITDGHFRSIIAINGQMPGPTIIAHKNQRLIITVYNELKNVEGISIHWHGMHQKGTQKADGVAYVTQLPIMPGQNYNYDFKASPSGTHWYHAHSGAQRTDGLYGALIIKDDLPGDLYDYDYPEQHTLVLMDWQRHASIDLFHEVGSRLDFWKDNPQPKTPPFTKYVMTATYDGTIVGPVPFWSGIINDKGRLYDENGKTNVPLTSLNHFNCKHGKRYRFRLIGAEGVYAFKFHIIEHKLTVIASDGAQIKSIKNVDYVIVNTGERYDVVVTCDKEVKDYPILAETLEDGYRSSDKGFYNPVDYHKAEAVLHYVGAKPPLGFNYSRNHDSATKFKVVNCPFKDSKKFDCINVDKFEPYDMNIIPQSVIGTPKKTLFYSFGFDGELSTHGSSIDGINFRFPSQSPFDDITAFEKDTCPKRGCDHEKNSHCACTNVIDLHDFKKGDVVEIVMVNRGVIATQPSGTSHPIHLHGHYFYITDVGYPIYNDDGHFKQSTDKVECIMPNKKNCEKFFITSDDDHGNPLQTVQWLHGNPPTPQGKFALKDTVIIPYGGYTTIRFVVDNPGWWFFHCHIEEHQLQGMAAIIKEL